LPFEYVRRFTSYVFHERPETTTGDCTIRKPMRSAPEREPQGPRINDAIRAREVRLIDENGQNVGVVQRSDALERATTAGLDLVEISPDAEPPVCKILDFGKYKYQEQKKAAEARKNQKIVEIKEIKMRPGIDDHDYDVKMRAIRRFFEEGDKVKVTLRFRGREMAHQELGMALMTRVKTDLNTMAQVETEPKLMGKSVTMTLAPLPANKRKRHFLSDHELPSLESTDEGDEDEDDKE